MNMRIDQGAAAAVKLAEVSGADDFLLLCDLDQWAAERRTNPTAAEAVEDRYPDRWQDAD